MRTTLNLDDHLVRTAKQRAAARGTTLTRLIEEALRVALIEPPPASDYRLRLPIVRGRRAPVVAVGDRAAMSAPVDEPSG